MKVTDNDFNLYSHSEEEHWGIRCLLYVAYQSEENGVMRRTKDVRKKGVLREK